MPCIHIIEDDVDLLELLTSYLQGQGYQVCDDYNGNRYEAGDDTLPDLFLIDVHLKDKSGLDICRNLKNSLAPHPVILMSAADNLPVLARQCMADGYIQKPFALDELKKKIALHMQ
jgi:two-component system phosphate regulon response regulator PhoB